MQDKLKNLIERFQNDGDLVIRNQNFLNEIIFESIFSVAVFDQVSISNCKFEEAQLDDINFEATIINDLKTKNTTFLNLHFNKKFPMSFWKSNHRIDITNSLSFENFLKDMTYE